MQLQAWACTHVSQPLHASGVSFQTLRLSSQQAPLLSTYSARSSITRVNILHHSHNLIPTFKVADSYAMLAACLQDSDINITLPHACTCSGCPQFFVQGPTCRISTLASLLAARHYLARVATLCCHNCCLSSAS